MQSHWKRFGMCVAGVLFGLCPYAHAFHLEDHRAITEQAIAEFRQCVPESNAWLSTEAEDALIGANLEEDINLIRKWLHYSHYYNPNKTLDMLRADSSVTVRDAENELLRTDRTDTLSTARLLGRIVHHIQDMWVPAHVVPVRHGANDGFEVFSAPIAAEDRESILCDWAHFAVPESVVTLHRNAALSSIQALDQPLTLVKNGAETSFNWADAFWKPSPTDDESFGAYGALGNHFGETDFSIGDDEYEISQDRFADFKSQRLRSAVDSSRLVLLWWQRRLNQSH